MSARRKSTPEDIERNRARMLDAWRNLTPEDIEELARSLQERKLARIALRERKQQAPTRH